MENSEELPPVDEQHRVNSPTPVDEELRVNSPTPVNEEHRVTALSSSRQPRLLYDSGAAPGPSSRESEPLPAPTSPTEEYEDANLFHELSHEEDQWCQAEVGKNLSKAHRSPLGRQIGLPKKRNVDPLSRPLQSQNGQYTGDVINV